MSLREEIIQQALGLPPDDRAFVADTLEQSLPHGNFASPELAAAWSEEIDRRIAAFDRGDVRGLEFGVALDQLRQTLVARRAGRTGS